MKDPFTCHIRTGGDEFGFWARCMPLNVEETCFPTLKEAVTAAVERIELRRGQVNTELVTISRHLVRAKFEDAGEVVL